jgi:predicted PhzF superfamily epimerase YddE/YHI9
VLHVRVDTPDRVTIGGNAVTVWEGTLKK